jgi:hypothetical protein
MAQAHHILDSALASTMHATRCAMHHALGMLPGAFVFQRDMFLNTSLIANLQTIQDKRQVLIDEKLRHQNLKWCSFDYAINQEVLIKVPKPQKLDDRAEGPYTITQVHVNGTITLRRSEHVMERINICRVIPYRRPD